MTELLKKAFEEASKLPPKEQDEFAALVLAELEADRQWEDTRTRGRNGLESLAREALEDLRAGRTDLLKPDDL